MFIHRALLRPAIGHGPALRDLLVQGGQVGDRTIVAQRLWGETPLFAVNRAFESLAALEEWRRGWQPPAAIAKELGALPATELWETPQTLAAAPAGSAPKFTLRFTFNGTLGGHLRELREAVERLATALPGPGRPSNVWVRVSGGPASLAVVRGFDSLSGIEKQRASAIANPAVQQSLAQIAGLVGTPIQTPDWFEILVAPA